MNMPLSSAAQASLILNEGGVILHPTETCYGFACDATRESAFKKLYQLKQMPLAKPSSIMVLNLEEARKYADFSELAEKLASEFWPGPLTLILSRKNLPDFLNPGISTIGIRVPGHSFTLEMLRACPFPLITTSANLSGKPEAYQVSEVLLQLKTVGNPRPDFIVDVGKIPPEKPSTIIEIRGKFLRFLREGSLASQILEKYFNYFDHGGNAE